MKTYRLLSFVVTILTLLALYTAHAAINVQGYWRLGEMDPAAASDTPVSGSTRDLMDRTPMIPSGRLRYTNDVAPAATTRAGSVLAVAFAGGYFSNAVMLADTDNFGVEAWVKINTDRQNHVVVSCGDNVANGWAIRQLGAAWEGEISGQTRFGSGALTVNDWTHLAMVRSGGITTLYVNGVPSGTTARSIVRPTSGSTIGAYFGGTSQFSGGIDEVRVFNFESGAFTTNDLLLYAPPPFPVIASQYVTNVAAGEATLVATLQPLSAPTAIYFRYGTSTNYDRVAATNLLPASSSAQTVTNRVSHLAACNQYHFQAVAANAVGMTTSADVAWQMDIRPEITTGTYGPLTIDGAFLQASIDPKFTVAAGWVEWGTTRQYGQRTEPVYSSGGSVNFSTLLSGLESGATYHYRAVGSNCAGISYGFDRTFRAPATLLVTSLASAGRGSLRAAFASAGEGDVIVAGVEGVISLAEGELVVSNTLALFGPGSDRLTLTGGNTSRLFRITESGSLTISNLALEHGYPSVAAPSSADSAENGGAILNNGSLLLADCVLRGNVAGAANNEEYSAGEGGLGGALYNSGDVRIFHCSFENNAAGSGEYSDGGRGGAIFNDGNLWMVNSTIVSNRAGNGLAHFSAGGSGGGVFNDGYASLLGCTLNGNAAGSVAAPNGNGGDGGAIFNFGRARLLNSTLDGNNAGAGGDTAWGGNGGGICSYSDLSLENCTITRNRGGAGGVPGSGGGLAAFVAAPALRNVILAENAVAGRQGTNLFGTIIAGDLLLDTFEPVQTLTNLGAIFVSPNVRLGPLTNNGGPTFTRALLADSPARDRGTVDELQQIDIDQRGFPRLAGNRIDLGAIEFQPPSLPPRISGIQKTPKGAVELTFTNSPDAQIVVYSTTNAARPRAAWESLGAPQSISFGQFSFIDTNAAHRPNQFYELRVINP